MLQRNLDRRNVDIYFKYLFIYTVLSILIKYISYLRRQGAIEETEQ